MLVISDADVEALLPVADAISLVREAFIAFSRGDIICPQRLPLPLQPPGAVLLSMPAYDGHLHAGVKLVAVQPANAGAGLPVVRGTYMLFDARTAEALALMSATRLTALRTGAAGGLAADLLARREAKVLAAIGAGVQAETQILGALSVRPIEMVWVYDQNQAQAAALVERLRPRVQVRLAVATTAAEAIAGADIVVTATNARTPVFPDDAVREGTHITAVGAYTTEMQEVPDATVARAALYVDSREAAWAECGELHGSLARGSIGHDHVRGEIGDLAKGIIPGRQSEDEITMFKSVGLAAQDLFCAAAVYRRARAAGRGVEVSL